MTQIRGSYFYKKQVDQKPLPDWENIKQQLPDPVFQEKPQAVTAYWQAWQLAIESMQQPQPGSGLVSNHMAFDFNAGEAIFAHDSALMTMYGRFGFKAFSAIETLDNFYARQHDNGEICREINRLTGEDIWPNDEGEPMTVRLEGPWEEHHGDWSKVKSYKWNRPSLKTHPQSSNCRIDGMTDHKFLWAEYLNYKLTGNKKRLLQVIKPLQMWYEASKIYLQGDNGLFITDWAGMDNSPRNLHAAFGVDISSQMVYRAKLLSKIFSILGDSKHALKYALEAEEIAELIRTKMWNKQTGFFHDIAFDGNLEQHKTIAGFWPLFAEIADQHQAESLIAHLDNPETFKAPVMVPSLARDEIEYTPHGEYYLGGVWPWTNAMVIEGLEKYGNKQLATKIAHNYWEAAVKIFNNTGTVWEYFAPESQVPGSGSNPEDPGKNARKDFAGWGPYPLVSTFLEHVIGLKADGPKNKLTWTINSLQESGCNNFAFGDVIADISVENRTSPDEEPKLTVETNKSFELKLIWGHKQQHEKTLTCN